jgi:hypothetical protein
VAGPVTVPPARLARVLPPVVQRPPTHPDVDQIMWRIECPSCRAYVGDWGAWVAPEDSPVTARLASGPVIRVQKAERDGVPCYGRSPRALPISTAAEVMARYLTRDLDAEARYTRRIAELEERAAAGDHSARLRVMAERASEEARRKRKEARHDPLFADYIGDDLRAPHLGAPGPYALRGPHFDTWCPDCHQRLRVELPHREAATR